MARAISRGGRWRFLMARAISRSRRWRFLMARAISRGGRWRLLMARAISRNGRWRFLMARAISRDGRWRLLMARAISRDGSRLVYFALHGSFASFRSRRRRWNVPSGGPRSRSESPVPGVTLHRPRTEVWYRTHTELQFRVHGFRSESNLRPRMLRSGQCRLKSRVSKIDPGARRWVSRQSLSRPTD